MKDFIKPARTFALSATSFIVSAIAAVLVITALAACAGRSVSSAPKPNTTDPSALGWNKDAKKTMRAFGSEDELKNYFRQLAEERKRALERARREASANPPAPGLAGVANQTASPAKAAEGYAAKDEESITNTQHAGVDEGGIVKLHGDHLVVLRRGRLFTVAIGDGALKPISAVDAFGPEIDPRYTWYDEMLVSEDMVAVIGYSYERGGTEVGLFRIDRAGNLEYRSTYHLRSNDYYSSRNYASRLIGSKLIFYTPLSVRAISGGAQVAQGRDAAGISANRFRDARVSSRASARFHLRCSATYGHGLRFGARRFQMRCDCSVGRAGPRVLCLARFGLRLDNELGALRTENE